MRGSLDQPPLVIARARLPVLPYALVSLGLFAALCAGLRNGEIPASWIAWSLGVVALVLSLYFTRQVVWPDYIAITRDGLYSQTWRGMRRFGWRDISKFSSHEVRGRRGVVITLVGFSPVAALGRPSVRQQVNMLFWGDNEAMAGPWEIPVQQVASLLNEARAKWGGWVQDTPAAGGKASAAAPRWAPIYLYAASLLIVGGLLAYLWFEFRHGKGFDPPPIVQNYPTRALRENAEGRVVLSCRVTVGFGLSDCAVAEETPAGYGFGEAALRLAPGAKLPPQDRTRVRPGELVRFPVRFRQP